MTAVCQVYANIVGLLSIPTILYNHYFMLILNPKMAKRKLVSKNESIHFLVYFLRETKYPSFKENKL